jgi:hypothetical protein
LGVAIGGHLRPIAPIPLCVGSPSITDCPDFAENCLIFRKSRRGRQLMLDSPLSILVTGPQVTGTLLWFHPLCRKKNSSSSSYEWKKDTQLDGGFCYL